MASVKDVLSDLHALKDWGHALRKTCKRDDTGALETLIADLSAFLSVLYDVLIKICAADYATRPDVATYNSELLSISKIAHDDFAHLEDILLTHNELTQGSSFAFAGSNERQKIGDIGYKISLHGKTLERTISHIAGMEDWTRLSPNPPVTPPRDKGAKTDGKSVKFAPSTPSSGSRSAPPSPYQATVEDAPDEEDISSDHAVLSYHMPGPEPSAEPGAEDIKRRPSPPRVVLRSPTDPNRLLPEIKRLDFDDPLESKQTANVFTAWSNMVQPAAPTAPEAPTVPAAQQYIADPDPWVPNGSPSNPQSREEVGATIRRLRSEIERLSSPSDTGSSEARSAKPQRASPERPSVPTLAPSPRPRPRASTLSTTDIPRPMTGLGLTTDEGEDRLSRLPRISPRYSPITPPLSSSPRMGTGSPRSGVDGHRFHYHPRDHAHEPTPHTSLPSVLLNGTREGDDRRHKRASWAADDFHNTGAYQMRDQIRGDFTLFGDNDGTSRPRKSSNREELPPYVTQRELPISLDDMLRGAVKKVRYKRRIPDELGVRLIWEDRVLKVPIPAGLRPGSRLKYPGEGNYVEYSGRLGDLWFVLVEKPHETFTRRHSDLHAVIEVPLYEALCGWTRTLTSICGKPVRVSHLGPTPPGWSQCCPALGLPAYDAEREAPGERGDLFVEVKVVFPNRLDSWQRGLVRRALGSEASSGR